MNFLRKLDHNFLAALVVGIVSLLGFGVTGFLIPTSYIDIPLGFIFSGAVIASLYVVSHFLIKIDEKNGTSYWSIASIILRLVILVGVLVILGFMNYRWNIKLFNIFVFVAIYTIGVATFSLSYIRKRKE